MSDLLYLIQKRTEESAQRDLLDDIEDQKHSVFRLLHEFRNEVSAYIDLTEKDPETCSARVNELRARVLYVLEEYLLPEPVTPKQTERSLPREDAPRLKTNREKVFGLMSDGQWHTSIEICKVGGSQGLRRLRELRAEGRVISKRRVRSGSGLFEYRITYTHSRST